MEYRTINNGIKMPTLGFGVFQVADPKICEESVLTAIRHGYRLIDTAAVYGNEEAVGAAIRNCGVPREELFITTKLWVQDAGYEKTKAALAASLDRLGLRYLDLYLIHRPFGDYYGAWRAMEELYEEGKVRAIGVSNFGSDRIIDLIMNNRIRPAVNQIECHPFFQQDDAKEICREYGVQMEAWAPFAEGKQGIFKNEVLTKIGGKYGKSAAQVILRWNIDRGVVVIPKSTHEERIAQNIDVFDFRLTKEDMDEIAALDGGQTFFGRNEDPQYAQARYCQAMTDADIETMRELVSEDMVFTHMSGMQQTREEYFADVADGSLNYFTIGIEDPLITVDGEKGQITYTSVLNANAYGARGTYRMKGTHHYEKRDGAWIAVNR